MADITMCKNLDCPLRHGCYRYMAKPDEFRQSYAAFTPDKDGKCRDYIEYDSKAVRRD